MDKIFVQKRKAEKTFEKRGEVGFWVFSYLLFNEKRSIGWRFRGIYPRFIDKNGGLKPVFDGHFRVIRHFWLARASHAK